jgi:hypothetical protein
MLNAASPHFLPRQEPTKILRRFESGFEELIKQPVSSKDTTMSDNRPDNLKHFVTHKEKHMTELQKPNHDIMLALGEKAGALSLDEVADCVAAGGLVTPPQLEDANRDGVIRSIPLWIWEHGYTVQAWSSLTDANINILRFKIRVDLVGFPIECMHEDEVVSVVSHFGTYLDWEH